MIKNDNGAGTHLARLTPFFRQYIHTDLRSAQGYGIHAPCRHGLARSYGTSMLVTVEISSSMFSCFKWRDDGRLDFISPIPWPFNYGHIPQTRAGDGDCVDALVLGRRLRRGDRVVVPARGVVYFVDAGCDDPKWICSYTPLTRAQRWKIDIFFHVYAQVKRRLNGLRGLSGATHFSGWGPVPGAGP
jgi:inorganic pyrophosphatase